MAIADELSGFDAIQPPGVSAPYARRKIIKGPDGTPQVVLVDMQGNTITDPSGYGIVESGNYMDPASLPGSATPVETKDEDKEPSAAREVIRSTARSGAQDGDSSPGSGNFGRSPANNFGYVDKPGFMGLAGLAPGPIGLAGKAVNAGINANNVAAVNSARGMMGLEGVGIGGAIKGTVKDNKGQVADVTFGDSQYATPVGLEAMSPEGMTNMTPAEAAARARAVGSIQMATPEQIAARDEAFNAEFAKPGLIGRMTNVATSFLDNMFGVSTPSYQQYDDNKHNAIKSQNSGANFNPTDSGFADMIGASKKSGKSNYGSGFNPTPGGFADAIGASGRGSSGSSSGGAGRGSSAGKSSNPGTSGNMGRGGGTTSGHGPGIGSA